MKAYLDSSWGNLLQVFWFINSFLLNNIMIGLNTTNKLISYSQMFHLRKYFIFVFFSFFSTLSFFFNSLSVLWVDNRIFRIYTSWVILFLRQAKLISDFNFFNWCRIDSVLLGFLRFLFAFLLTVKTKEFIRNIKSGVRMDTYSSIDYILYIIHLVHQIASFFGYTEDSVRIKIIIIWRIHKLYVLSRWVWCLLFTLCIVPTLFGFRLNDTIIIDLDLTPLSNCSHTNISSFVLVVDLLLHQFLVVTLHATMLNLFSLCLSRGHFPGGIVDKFSSYLFFLLHAKELHLIVSHLANLIPNKDTFHSLLKYNAGILFFEFFALLLSLWYFL